jgi:hypothetical protein
VDSGIKSASFFRKPGDVQYSTLGNSAPGPDYDTSYNQERFNGSINGLEWGIGRWSGKKALNFDGVDDCVDLGYWDVGSDDFPSNELTITAWFKADSFPNDPRIISKADGTSTDNHWFIIGIDNGPETLFFRLKTKGNNTVQLTATGIDGVIATDEWTFVAATYDGTTMTLYKNGVSIESSNATSGELARNRSINIRIGANPVGPRWFDGLIDEVIVLRRALTDNEIKDYFNSSRP